MNKKLKIYFAGSITGGREFEKYQQEIVNLLKLEGRIILTEHVSNNELQKEVRSRARDSDDFYRFISVHDRKRMNKAELLVAECSQASLGVGFEICYAAFVRKIPVVALCHIKAKKKISPIIFGDASRLITPYFYGDKDLQEVLLKAIKSWHKKG